MSFLSGWKAQQCVFLNCYAALIIAMRKEEYSCEKCFKDCKPLGIQYFHLKTSFL